MTLYFMRNETYPLLLYQKFCKTCGYTMQFLLPLVSQQKCVASSTKSWAGLGPAFRLHIPIEPCDSLELGNEFLQKISRWQRKQHSQFSVELQLGLFLPFSSAIRRNTTLSMFRILFVYSVLFNHGFVINQWTVRLIVGLLVMLTWSFRL